MEENELTAIKCCECGCLHDKKCHDYVKVEGNILIGQDKGLVGGKDGSISYFCISCFVVFANNMVDNV
jgi:hypothetical protein